MRVLLGTDQALEGFTVEADASEGWAALLAKAEALQADRGPETITTDDLDPDAPDAADILAARLSAVAFHRPVPNSRVVTLTFPDRDTWDYDNPEVWDEDEVWAALLKMVPEHCASKPTWVACDDNELEARIARRYGASRGTPADVEHTHYTQWGPPGTGPVLVDEDDPRKGYVSGVLSAITGPLLVMLAMLSLTKLGLYLKTNAGNDFQARVMGDTASTGTGSYASATWIGVSEDAGAPAAGDTTLTGELSGGGFTRKQAAYGHTAGVASYTETTTFTSSDATARTLRKRSHFNASSAGSMVFESAIPSPPTLVSGDSVVLTDTVTL